MTTFTNFVPSTSQAFSFQPVLDGQTYNATVTWNVFGQRWYLNLYSLNGVLIVSQPLIASPSGVTIESLSWSTIGIVTATTEAPHGYTIGSVVALTISGATPSAYSGLFDCLIISPTEFQYDLAPDPGAATSFGVANFNLNLVGGFSDENGSPFTSSLVFRETSSQFEVSP